MAALPGKTPLTTSRVSTTSNPTQTSSPPSRPAFTTPLTQPNGIPHTQVEYKLRRLVNPADSANDLVKVVDPEGLKEVYGATRDKVSWWPLK